MTDDATLRRVLSEIQRRGAIGRGPIDAAIDHARRFVVALPAPVAGHRLHLVDLGSGGGLPGLVIAADRQDAEVTLVERREKRADLLRYGVRALGIDDRVTVVASDVAHLGPQSLHAFGAVTARSFAPPLVVLEIAASLLAPGGWCLISDPPDARDRWTASDLQRLGLLDDGHHHGVHRFVRAS